MATILDDAVPADGDGVTSGTRISEICAAIRTLRAAINTATLDEDDMASDSDTELATQQSIKAYVDSFFPRLNTGSYTGNGSVSMAVTGIGFQPTYVKIWERSTSVLASIEIFETTDTIIDDNASKLSARHISSGGHSCLADRIISLDADGFTVDDAGADGHPNKNGQGYNYLAMR